MKTMEAFIKEIEGSAALKDELKAIKGKDALAAFLKKNDVGGTVEDFVKALKAKTEAEGEISDDAVEAVSGGEYRLRDKLGNYITFQTKEDMEEFFREIENWDAMKWKY